MKNIEERTYTLDFSSIITASGSNLVLFKVTNRTGDLTLKFASTSLLIEDDQVVKCNRNSCDEIAHLVEKGGSINVTIVPTDTRNTVSYKVEVVVHGIKMKSKTPDSPRQNS